MEVDFCHTPMTQALPMEHNIDSVAEWLQEVCRADTLIATPGADLRKRVYSSP